MTKPMNRSQRKRLQKNWTQATKHFPGLAGLMAGATLLLNAPAAFAAGEIQIVTTFDPNQINQGSPGTLRYVIRNNEATPLAGASLTKTLPTGFVLDVANLPTATGPGNTCGLTIDTSTAGSLRITGGTLPPTNTAASPPVPGRCDLALPIIGKKAPSPTIVFDIAIGEFRAGGFSNTELSPGRLTVRQLGNLSPTMTFGPTVLPSRGRTRFNLGMVNNTGIALTNASFTSGFSIPAGFTLVGTPTNTCTGATLDLGATGLGATPPIIRLLSGTIPAAGCSFSFEFEGPTVATEQSFGPISWAANDLVTTEEVSNNASSSNSGTLEGGIKVEQSFSLNPVYINEDSTMTIRIRNANDSAIANNTLTSIINNAGGTADRTRLLLGGAGNLGDVTSTCPTVPTVAYTPATGQLQLTNVSAPASVLTPAAATAVGECTITLKMVGLHDSANAVPSFTSIGSYTSTIATGQLTAQGLGVSNQLAVTNAGLTIQDLGGSGPGVGVGVGIRTQYSSNGVDFGTARVAASNRGIMRIWLDNNAGETLNGVAIGGTGIALPANLRIADGGAIGGNCTNPLTNVTAPVGGAIVTMTGGTIARRNSCYIDINVVSDNVNLTPGYDATADAGVISTAIVTGQNGRSYTNAAKTIGGSYLEVNDFLTVYPSMATAIVAPNADARVRLRLANSQSVAKAGARLRYRLPFTISGSPDYEADAACGIGPGDFSIDTVGADQFLVINSLNIPASSGSKAPALPVEYGDAKDGACNIAFDVTSPTTLGGQTVSVPVGTLQDATGTQENRRVETTSFTVQALGLDLSQRFTSFDAPATTITELVGAEPAFIEVRLTNPTSNPLALTNIILNDTLEDATARIYPGAQPFTDCVGAGGLPATATVNEAAKSFRLTGVNLAVGASCIVRIPVTTLSVALLTNDIAAEAAVSLEGAKSIADGDSVTTSPNIALVKTFDTPTLSPDGLATIATDGIARLNLTVLNATTRAYNDLSVADNLPAGLKLAPNANLASTCGAVSAPGEGVVIRLSNGSILNNASCTIAVDVTSLQPSGPGGYENIIPVGGLTAGAFQNSKPATAKLVVTGTSIERPSLRLVKRITEVKTLARPGFAEQIIPITSVNDFTPASGPDTDSAPGWPGPNATSGISTYLQGAYQTSQIPGGQSETLTSGMEIEYSGYYLSNGTGSAENTELCDAIPANTTFVPGSLRWVRGDSTTQPIADATGFTTTPPASCDGADHGKGAVVVNLGSLPQSTGVGAPANSYGKIVFRVKVD